MCVCVCVCPCKSVCLWRGCPCDVKIKAMNCRIVVSEFEPQSRNYLQFQANTLGKGMKPLIFLTMG